jgi:23S rRNA pseudouridine1911/1915/1917 synthase
MSAREIRTDRGDAGRRLDLVLRRHVHDVDGASRTRIQAWIESGCVLVNGGAIRRVSTRVAAGDRLTLCLPDAAPRARPAAESMALRILFEDAHMLAVDKPAGTIVHPAYRHPTGTLVNGLLWHARTWPAPQRPSLVGRIDKLTSGVVLVAKSAPVHAMLQRTAIQKEYLALVYGRVNVARGSIELRLRKDPRDRRTVIASPHTGAPSVTRFRRVARTASRQPPLSLLCCSLVTGRTHQIRVHLAARGWPIVGDATYGQPGWMHVADSCVADALRAFPRQALHAWRLSFAHPVSGERIEIEAPLPRDLADLIELTGLVARSRSLGSI